jgi:hypothetical protein
MNQAEMTHSGRPRSSHCCKDHGAAFELRLRTGKDELLDLFFGKGSRIGTGAGQNVGARYFAQLLIKLRPRRITRDCLSAVDS